MACSLIQQHSWDTASIDNIIFLKRIIIKCLLFYIDGLVQERCDSSVVAMELCLSCTNPSISSSKLCLSACLFYKSFHYSDAAWAFMWFMSPATQLFSQQFVQLTTKEKSMPSITGAKCEGNPPVTNRFPHKWPVIWKEFPWNEAIMLICILFHLYALEFNFEQLTYFQKISLSFYLYQQWHFTSLFLLNSHLTPFPLSVFLFRFPHPSVTPANNTCEF